jgi:hypothetical protein
VELEAGKGILYRLLFVRNRPAFIASPRMIYSLGGMGCQVKQTPNLSGLKVISPDLRNLCHGLLVYLISCLYSEGMSEVWLEYLSFFTMEINST